MGLELIVGIGQSIIAFIFAFLFISTRDSKNWLSYLFLALAIMFATTSFHAIYIISVDCAYCGVSTVGVLHTAWFVMMIPSIILIVFFMIYKIIFIGIMKNRLGEKPKEEDEDDE
jgi:hypothetical protein